MVRDLLAAVTADDLDAAATNPWSGKVSETVRSCLHVILDEELARAEAPPRPRFGLGRRVSGRGAGPS